MRLRNALAPLRGSTRSRVPRLLLALALSLAACSGLSPRPGADGQAEPLPTDPTVVRGTLPNGLAYVVQRHSTPPGRLGIWLHVATGSLNETDDTRGLAHYLEHMAFNGSASFPPGTLVPFFQSLGLSFGRDQNAFTGLEQTVYTLALPDTQPATLDRALLYLSDVAFRLTLAPAEIEAERQIILEERRARAGARQRVNEAVLERLAPESTLGRRLPIGTEATIRAVTPAQFREYYSRWYVPANMTVIAVGDVEPAQVVTAVARHFGEAPPGARPRPRPVGVGPTTGRRAIVVTDAELTEAEVSLVRVGPAQPPMTTVADCRQRLVERVGTWAFNRRLQADLAEGRAAFLRGDASVDDWAQAMRVGSVRATATPDRWRPALADLGTALQRARLHGFTAGELEEARTALLAEAEQAARQEPTVPARARLGRLNEALRRGEPVMSAAQRLALGQRLLPGISGEEVRRTFARELDPSGVVVVLKLPASAPAPSEAQLVALGGAALDVRPAPLAERERPSALLATLPRGGAVVQALEHADTGVWSGWLDNGVRVHHRRLEGRKNEVAVRITLAGGVIEERPETRGITEAAVRAWNRPATRTLSSTQIRSLMTGQRVRLSGWAGADTVVLDLTGDPASLESGLQLAYLLLTEPVVEAAGFEQWRERTLQEIAERAVQPRGALREVQAEAFYPAGETRLRPLTEAQARALGREAVQGWLRDLSARAPIEVAVVGDIDRARAAELVTRYLGALPPRPRIGAATLSALRGVPRPDGPVRVTRTVATRTDQAWVEGGFFGPDLVSVRDTRLLALASRVLTTRMNRVIREERQLVYSIGAFLRPGDAYPGLGIFAAQAPTDPTKAEALAGAVEAMFAAFAVEGPTAEELDVARRQLHNQIEEDMQGPDFWTARLGVLEYRGLSLDDVARLAVDLQGYRAEEVREAFARYAQPGASFRLVVLPDRDPR